MHTYANGMFQFDVAACFTSVRVPWQPPTELQQGKRRLLCCSFVAADMLYFGVRALAVDDRAAT
jgi:hypothetical protein